MRSQHSIGIQRQRGLYVVEFSLVAGLFFVMLFGSIEVSRMFFTMSALDAMTQRGARIATVCPLNDALVQNVAIFGENGNSVLVRDITPANIAVRYLTANGNPTGIRSNVRYVEVSIQNYTHQMLIPETIANFVAPSITSPSFTTTRPAESLGRHPGGANFC